MESRKQENGLSTLTMASYGIGKFLGEFLTGAYGLMVYYFFETELGLSGLYVAIATIIYSVWNAINDPLIGYLTSKESKFTRKFGRRTPWIINGLILCSLMFIIIFAVPKQIIKKQTLLFIWMVVFVCLYDLCYSLWELNYQGVFPDKFRTMEDRTKAASIGTFIGVFGIALGSVLPPMFYTYGKPQSFLKSALIIFLISLLGTVLIKNGVKETPQMIKRNQERKSSEYSEKSFVQALKDSLKHKEFLALVLMLFLYQSACMCMTSSVNYVAHGVLGFEKGSATTPIFAGMLIGALISILVWKEISKRIKNNQKLLIITSFFMAISSAMMFLCNTQLQFAIGMFVWGLGFGGYWTFMTPAMADVVDSIVVKEKKRDDGILMGIRAFFMRLSYASQAIVFWLCHKLTNYDPSIKGIQNSSARIGIKLHMTAIPALFFCLSAIVMITLNTLTPELVKENKEKLKEYNL